MLLPTKSQKKYPIIYPMTPPKTENSVQIILIKSHLFFFAKTIGIKKISGGIGKIIDSKNENKLKSFTEFLFFDTFNVLSIILKISFLNFFMINYFLKLIIISFFLFFSFLKYNIAENNQILLNEVLPGILIYYGENEEPNEINKGAIANKIAIIGNKSILVYDAGPSKEFAERFIKELRKYSKKPIKYLVISHRHFDHAYGIEVYIKKKVTIFIDKTEYSYLKKEGPLINNLLIKNLGFNEDNINFDNISEEKINFLADSIEVNLGNRRVLIKNLGIAHTKGDLIAYDFNTNTYITGDVIFIGRAAAFSDANIPMWINVINNKLDLSWDYLIPGHGSIINNKLELNDTKNWLHFLDNAVRQAVSEGDMISEIFQYPIPKEIHHLKMKSITLRQGIKKQLNLYRKKYIE